MSNPDLDEAHAQLRIIVRWLVDNGFPFGRFSPVPAPAFLREPLAAEWARRGGVPVEDCLGSVDAEQEWSEEAQINER